MKLFRIIIKEGYIRKLFDYIEANSELEAAKIVNPNVEKVEDNSSDYDIEVTGMENSDPYYYFKIL